MNPAQQAFSGPIELCLKALEQALADSQAKERETQKQLDMLIIRFRRLEGIISELKDFLKNVSITTLVVLLGRPPPPALPTEFDGEQSRGQAFLTSVQTYIHLCPNSFHSDQVKITWALSYMKSGRATKWAAQIFRWEEENEGYSKFLDWDEF